MGTVVICTLAGAALGAVVAIGLYILGFGAELLNCVCNIITCNCDGGDAIPGMWRDGTFMSVLIFCVIGGAVIGFIYGLVKVKAANDAEIARRNAENSEGARKQRERWAGEVKSKALNVANTCEENYKNVSPLVNGTYKGDAQMSSILQELSNIAELKGKVEAMADDTKKGGASE